MSPKVVPDSSQGRFDQMASPIDWQQKISPSKLLRVLHERDQGLPPPTAEELQLIEPSFLISNLYVPENLKDRDVNNAYSGVIFPAAQYVDLVRRPSDYGRQIAAKTQAANRLVSDKAEVRQTAIRSVVHALGNSAIKLASLQVNLGQELDNLRIIHRQFKAPGRAHFLASNLKDHIDGAEKSIRGSIKTVAEAQSWDRQNVQDAENALQFKLYGQTSNKRIVNWRELVILSGRHVANRYHAVGRNLLHVSEYQASLLPEIDTDGQI